MIEYTQGDILQADVEALVNTVNCVGIMGRGIALQFKRAYPDNFKAYVLACKREEIKLGKLFVFETGKLTSPRYIINFPTKNHWRSKSRIEDIESGLETLIETIQQREIRSIAIPPLGCGLGGLNWNVVRQKIENALIFLSDVRIMIYQPSSTPATEQTVPNSKVPRMTPGRAVMLQLMKQYYLGLLDPFITLLEVHKLMYFMQVAGEPLRLNYQKAPYGPYAENLRHVLHAIEGHFILGYGDGGDTPYKQLDLMPGVAAAATEFLQDYPETRDRFDRVAALVDGFESPSGLELLATIHWILAQESITSRQDVVRETYAWHPRKQQFTDRQIGLAVERLAQQGWVTALPEPGKLKP